MGMRHYNQGAIQSLSQVTVFTATTRYGAGIEYCKFRGKYVTILYAQKRCTRAERSSGHHVLALVSPDVFTGIEKVKANHPVGCITNGKKQKARPKGVNPKVR